MHGMSMKRDLRSFSKLRQRRKKCSLPSTFSSSGSLKLNIDLLLVLIKERSLLLKTAIDFEF